MSNPIQFSWDPRKAAENEKKHRLSFSVAKLVFSDPLARSAPDRIEEGEQRWQTIGQIHGVVIVVAHTLTLNSDHEAIRLISARKADRNERKRYEESY